MHLLVGVSGHADLRAQDVEPLRAAVRAVLEQLRGLCPHTPLALLSSLAEEADRLAADVALGMGIALIVPLLLPRAAYAEALDDEEALRDFDRLIGRAESTFVVPADWLGGDGAATVREDLTRRAGAVIVRNSQVLIALWDGLEAAERGGTSDVVEAHRTGRLAHWDGDAGRLDPPETGPVYHIVTPRRDRPAPPLEPLTIRRLDATNLAKHGASWASHHRLLLRLEAFNRDAVRLAPRLAEKARKCRAHLLGDDPADDLPAKGLEELDLHTLAHAMARHFQARVFRSLNVLLGLAFAWAVAMQAHNLLAASRAESLRHAIGTAVYLALFAAGLGYYAWARFADIHTRYLDYRALAEALRVRVFWRLAGVDAPVADHYLRKQRSELDWIRHALRHGDLADDRPDLGERGVRLALAGWIDDQARYFARKARRNVATSRNLDWLGSQVFSPMFVLMAVLKVSDATGLLVVAMTLSLVVAGLIGVYKRVRAFTEHAKQYSRLASLFDRARDRLHELLADGDLAKAREVLAILGREALVENGDWVLIHRDRPLELPHT